ncbi:hypothetical protein Pelo_18193 [Pelomyxa schiedti]|nr:hypothetical protein Pelo_18193 [Pelomyxa schiedti]
MFHGGGSVDEEGFSWNNGGTPIRRVSVPGRGSLELDLSCQELLIDVVAGSGNDNQTLSGAPSMFTLRDGVLPAALLANKAKQFDDGLCAAVELMAQHGTASFLGKRKFLTLLNEALERQGNPVPLIIAAAELGEGTHKDLKPRGLVENATKKIKVLTAVFQQDTLLHTPIGPPTSNQVRNAVTADPRLSEFYTKYLNFVSKFTGSFAKPGLFVRNFMKKLHPDGPISKSFNLMDAIVEGVKSGSLSLAPTGESGCQV